MNQDSRVKNHEFMPHHFPLLKILGPRVKNQNQRTKTQGPRTVSLNLSLYSIFNNPESKTKTQRTKTQGPRTMSHEWKPEPKSETHRTKIQDPEPRLQDTKVQGQRTNDLNHLAITHNKPAWKLMSQYDWVRFKFKKEPFMSNTTWSND